MSSTQVPSFVPLNQVAHCTTEYALLTCKQKDDGSLVFSAGYVPPSKSSQSVELSEAGLNRYNNALNSTFNTFRALAALAARRSEEQTHSSWSTNETVDVGRALTQALFTAKEAPEGAAFNTKLTTEDAFKHLKSSNISRVEYDQFKFLAESDETHSYNVRGTKKFLVAVHTKALQSMTPEWKPTSRFNGYWDSGTGEELIPIFGVNIPGKSDQQPPSGPSEYASQAADGVGPNLEDDPLSAFGIDSSAQEEGWGEFEQYLRNLDGELNPI